MAIILNPEYKVPETQEPNTYFSSFLDEHISTLYIVIDEIYFNKKESELRLKVDYYKSKSTRNKRTGLIKTFDVKPEDTSTFIGNVNIYKAAYEYLLPILNVDNESKFIGD